MGGSGAAPLSRAQTLCVRHAIANMVIRMERGRWLSAGIASAAAANGICGVVCCVLLSGSGENNKRMQTVSLSCFKNRTEILLF